jgi:hypothetical protein
MRALALAGLLLGSVLVPICDHINPVDRVDVYLSAALERIYEPFTIKTDRSKADYVIEGSTGAVNFRTITTHIATRRAKGLQSG